RRPASRFARTSRAFMPGARQSSARHWFQAVDIMARTTSSKTYLWCPGCRRSFTHADAPGGACPVCGGATQEMSRLAAIARGIMANEITASPLESKHRQLIRLIWTRNGAGEQYY